MRVLIAEDDPVSRHVLEAYLTKWGYEIWVAHDGREALESLQREDAPKLAILDWMMPGIDGVEIVRQLRERAALHYIYVLLLTAKGQKEDLVEGLDAGADDYLTKPFNAHELQARLKTGNRILELQDKLLEAQQALREEATHDHLTRAWNRAGILEILDREFARASRVGTSVAIAMADLDHFKQINDTRGHQAGDDVLREMARRMTASIRPYDSLGRYGGEEFVVVLPECSASSAFQQAERLRRDLGSNPVQTCAGPVSVSASVGVAATDQADCSGYAALLQAADLALYRAKAAGRNRIMLAAPDEVNPRALHLAR
ncbi:MAG: GGDEF domain-containing response regulator [Terriglobia bacterium]